MTRRRVLIGLAVLGGAAVAAAGGLVVVVAALCLASTFGWRHLLLQVAPWSAGRVRAWTSVWADQGRIVAEGIAGDDVIVTERFFIVLNGRPVRMVVVHIEFGGGAPRWQAQDLASYADRYRVHGIRLRGSARA